MLISRLRQIRGIVRLQLAVPCHCGIAARPKDIGFEANQLCHCVWGILQTCRKAGRQCQRHNHHELSDCRCGMGVEPHYHCANARSINTKQ